MSKENKHPYSVIVFFENGQKPKKWEYVSKLNSIALFLNKKFSSWSYMNVYDRKTSSYMKRFRRGEYIPAFL